MTFTFGVITVENRAYPRVIMGEDNFSGWFSKGNFSTEEERAFEYRSALEVAYSLGVRGYSISPQETLVRTLRAFKQTHSDIICIANPHWQSHYYIGMQSLWLPENLKRLGGTVYLHMDSSSRDTCLWFKNVDVQRAFSDAEIAEFRLDETEYSDRLNMFRDFCDFSVVGNLGHSALLLLGRQDIVEREINLVRKAGMVPIGFCQGGGLAVQKMRWLGVHHHWVWLNKHFSFPTLSEALSKIHECDQQITAYKVFDSPSGFNLRESIDFIRTVSQVKSIVVGVENQTQAQQTFSQLQKLYP